MLNWPAGGNASDGVWASHWYGAVHRSTGFADPEGPMPKLDRDQLKLEKVAMAFFEPMEAAKIAI